MVLSKKRELGDFQTPVELARVLVDDIWRRRPFDRVLEPTCGVGGFLRACAELPEPPSELIGIELQEAYVGEAAEALGQAKTRGTKTHLIAGDIFQLNLSTALPWQPGAGTTLVVGNPPWVTSSDLGGTDSSGRVPRSNIERLSGLDALTGAANFDIAEAIWLKLLSELAHLRPTIALLCKQSVAHRLLRVCSQLKLPISGARLTEIDAAHWFGIHADACFFELDVGTESPSVLSADVYESPGCLAAKRRLGLINDGLVSDLNAYDALRSLDGECPFTWRQGLKHDAASVMELVGTEVGLINKLGEPVQVEMSHRLPLAKGSDIYNGRPLTREVIVTQRSLGEDTLLLSDAAPALWRYLEEHREVFERRRSRIYRNRPAYSLFGIGPYAFAPYKVAVSGLHLEPRFRLFGPIDGRPVALDDTCYMLPFDEAETAAIVSALLNHDLTRRFIGTLTVPGAKRPLTKRLLRRVDLLAVRAQVDPGEIVRSARAELSSIGYPEPSLSSLEIRLRALPT